MSSNCKTCTLPNVNCDIGKKNPCDALCKMHYRAANVSGVCNRSEQACICALCTPP